jgi:drug/metabolite transporter (DMT)-like permease
MYLSVGAIISSTVYFSLKARTNRSEGRHWWTSQDFVLNGAIQWKRVNAFLLYCFLFFLIQNLAIVTLYFAERAEINSGTITTIWNAGPLFTSIMDLIMFNQAMKYYHIIGMVALVLCSVLLSLQDLIYPKEDMVININNKIANREGALPAWIPVLFGIITPMSFTANQMLAKSFRRGPVKFNN